MWAGIEGEVEPVERLPILQINSHYDEWVARWLSGRASNSGARGQGFDTYLRHVVSFSKTLYSLKSTGNTQEVVAPSRHD